MLSCSLSVRVFFLSDLIIFFVSAANSAASRILSSHYSYEQRGILKPDLFSGSDLAPQLVFVIIQLLL